MPREPNSRPLITAKITGPDPTKYKLPATTDFVNHDGTKRKMPAFISGKRLSANNKPGPSHMIPQFITRVGRTTAPAYSLYSRPTDQKRNYTPAPGKYSPEKYPIPYKKRAPSYSFGGRFADPKADKSPAPNNYALPSLFGKKQIQGPSAPSYSIRGRPKIGPYYENLQKTPGPGTYQPCHPNIYLSKGPAYSIKGRHDAIVDKVIAPGPGAYYPEKVWINRKTGPSFSFGIKHSENITMLINEPTVKKLKS